MSAERCLNKAMRSFAKHCCHTRLVLLTMVLADVLANEPRSKHAGLRVPMHGHGDGRAQGVYWPSSIKGLMSPQAQTADISARAKDSATLMPSTPADKMPPA